VTDSKKSRYNYSRELRINHIKANALGLCRKLIKVRGEMQASAQDEIVDLLTEASKSIEKLESGRAL